MPEEVSKPAVKPPAKVATDHVPPAIRAEDVMVSYRHHMANAREIRLQELARTNPDIADLLKLRKSKEK